MVRQIPVGWRKSAGNQANPLFCRKFFVLGHTPGWLIALFREKTSAKAQSLKELQSGFFIPG